MAYSITNSDEGCYEGTFVLINKLDIHDEDKLSEIESIITTVKAAELKSKPIQGSFDVDHYCTIHRYIFGDLYEWAGELRTIDISKKGTHFHQVKDLHECMDYLFHYLHENKCFIESDHDKFSEQIAEFYHDLNMLHPFREGNGRTERVFISQLIENAGYTIDFGKADTDFLMIATIHAAHGVLDFLKDFFRHEIKEIKGKPLDLTRKTDGRK